MLKFRVYRPDICNLRLCSTVPPKVESVRDFEDIPGPKGPLGLGNLFNYLPVIGKHRFDEIHKAGLYKYEKFGSIVKERMTPSLEIVWIFKPEDIALIFNDFNENSYPQRRSHLALQKYRKDRPNVYKTGGLLPTNGSEWWRIRQQLQKGLSSPLEVRKFLPAVDAITSEFIEQLPTNIEMDALPELSRLNLELLCFLAFEERMNSFSAEERAKTSRSSKLIQAAEDTNACTLPTDQGYMLWRYFETPKYRKLRKAQEYMESIAIELIFEKLNYFKEESTNRIGNQCGTKSLLEEYLKNTALDLSDIVGMAADLLLAGIDTTTYSESFALYHLANNKCAQRKLFEESLKILPNKTDAIQESVMLNQITYTRAVLKETLRLNPVSVGLGRVLNNSCILSGYRIPKDTLVVTQNMVACRLEENFRDPHKFIPDRWLNRNIRVNPYLVLPFGHGMRACIARRLAEQNMLVFLIKLIRNFEIIWTGETILDVKTLLINKPSHPVKISLSRR